VAIDLDGGRSASVFGASPTLDARCVAGRLAALADAHDSGDLLAMRVMVDTEHELVKRMQRGPRAEMHDGAGTLFIVPLDDLRLLTRDAEGHWRLWEAPRELALDVCLAPAKQR
jgi:hypothetical protein